MIDSKARKLQYLMINQLIKQGSVQLILPDGVKLDIGIIQEDEYGNLKKTDNYCYVIATRDGKTAMIDSYNLGLQFESKKDTIIFEDEVFDDSGKFIKVMDIV
jgi:hypothetical protein